MEFRSAVLEEKPKIYHPIRHRRGHLAFRSARKNTNFVEDVDILLPIKFRWISFSSIREVKNVSANQRSGGHHIFLIGTKTQTWERTLRSCFLSSVVEFRSAVSEEKSKMSQSIRDQSGHLVFPIGPKNTNFVEDVEILHPVSFVKFCSEEMSKMLKPIRGRGSHLVFLIGPKNTNLIADVEILLPVKFHWIHIQRFLRKSWKCKKLTTDDGQRVIPIVHVSLWLRCTKTKRRKIASFRLRY